MCDPVSLGVTMVGLAVAQGVQQNRAAKAQASSANKAAQAQEDRRQANARGANENFEEQIKRTRRKMNELTASTAEDIFNRRTEFLKARGSALAAAGSAGIEGVSINDLIVDFSMTTGRGDAVSQRNLAIGIQSIHDQELDLHAQTIARRESIPPPAGVAQFDPTAGFMTMASGIISAGSAYSASKAKTFKPTSTAAGLQIQGTGEFDGGIS